MLDSHCHVDQYVTPKQTISEATRRGVFIVAVTNLPSHFKIGLTHTKRIRNLRLAVGLHPLATQGHTKERDLFREVLPLTSFVGEIGLDFSRKGNSTRSLQVESFRFVATCLSGVQKVISVHSRKAESKVLEILEEFRITPVIFHWYSGPLKLIDQAVEQGHFFSINPSMIRSKSGQRIIDRIPPDRILTESDGPYIRVENKTVEPWHVSQVEDHLATCWQVDRDSSRKKIWNNFRSLLNGSGVMNWITS